MKLVAFVFAALLSVAFVAQAGEKSVVSKPTTNFPCDPLGVDRDCGKYGP